MTTTNTAGPRLSRTIPPPEANLTVDDFLARAEALQAHLRANQAATEERTYYSAETHELFLQQGFYRMLQPRTLGGYELTLSEFFRVVAEISRGCPSTGWCLALGSSHVVTFAAVFGAEVQQDAVGQDGTFIAPCRVVPSGQATRVDGGWVIDGVWDYCSGVPYSTHAMNAVLLPPRADGAPCVGLALIPRDKYTVLDDWGNLLGLRGSGSHSIRVESQYVPEGYVLDVPLNDLGLKHTVGFALHGNPLYTGRIQSYFFGHVLAVAIGIVRATLDEYRDALDTKRPMWAPASLRRDDSHYRQWWAEATSITDTVEAALLRSAELYLEYCTRGVRGGDEFSLVEDQRLKNVILQAAYQLTAAMDLLIRTGGSSWLADGTRTQRYWRDFSQFRSHVVNAMREPDLVSYAAIALESEVSTSPGEKDVDR